MYSSLLLVAWAVILAVAFLTLPSEIEARGVWSSAKRKERETQEKDGSASASNSASQRSKIDSAIRKASKVPKIKEELFRESGLESLRPDSMRRPTSSGISSGNGMGLGLGLGNGKMPSLEDMAEWTKGIEGLSDWLGHHQQEWQKLSELIASWKSDETSSSSTSELDWKALQEVMPDFTKTIDLMEGSLIRFENMVKDDAMWTAQGLLGLAEEYLKDIPEVWQMAKDAVHEAGPSDLVELRDMIRSTLEIFRQQLSGLKESKTLKSELLKMFDNVQGLERLASGDTSAVKSLFPDVDFEKMSKMYESFAEKFVGGGAGAGAGAGLGGAGAGAGFGDAAAGAFGAGLDPAMLSSLFGGEELSLDQFKMVLDQFRSEEYLELLRMMLLENPPGPPFDEAVLNNPALFASTVRQAMDLIMSDDDALQNAIESNPLIRDSIKFPEKNTKSKKRGSKRDSFREL